jgi:hypothetical protein
MRRHCLDALFLIQVYLGSEICPSVLGIVDFEFLLSTSEILLCSMSASHVKIVPLLDAHQLLMLFALLLFILLILLFFHHQNEHNHEDDDDDDHHHHYYYYYYYCSLRFTKIVLLKQKRYKFRLRFKFVRYILKDSHRPHVC